MHEKSQAGLTADVILKKVVNSQGLQESIFMPQSASINRLVCGGSGGGQVIKKLFKRIPNVTLEHEFSQ